MATLEDSLTKELTKEIRKMMVLDIIERRLVMLVPLLYLLIVILCL